MDDNRRQHVNTEGPCVITLRVDHLRYDKVNDKYSVILKDCKVANDAAVAAAANANGDVNGLQFEITDASKVLHVEPGAFMTGNRERSASQTQMDKVMEDTQKNRLTRTDKFFVLFWVIYIFVSVALLMFAERMSFVDALYFRIVTSFGVGYGDIVPVTATGKIVNMFFIILDLVKMAYIDWRVLSLLFAYRRAQQLQYSAAAGPIGNKSGAGGPLFFIILDLVKMAYIDWRVLSLLFAYRRAQQLQYSAAAGPIGNKSGAGGPLSRQPSNSTGCCWRVLNSRYVSLYIVLLLLLFVILGTCVMGLVEHFYWLDSLNWNFVTLALIGYGDVVPHTIGGKLFTVFYIVFGYVVLLLGAVLMFDQLMVKTDTNVIKVNKKVELTGLLSS
eukprot:CAMPEP_0202730654 /NCGR_PEP_ID=MMETSP1385-20130828/186749_1 /ASSEMBLY_ACC=CAM_ASM_000861 /TAXON_ID=933848 /ORGANISM="Elphidium margaritaceum" /LENGTH=386 /DNA_ID=CAMNT_0049396931 /DNA_START=18 /DNA_END=1178 /DNA_ORIENTATION=+